MARRMPSDLVLACPPGGAGGEGGAHDREVCVLVDVLVVDTLLRATAKAVVKVEVGGVMTRHSWSSWRGMNCFASVNAEEEGGG